MTSDRRATLVVDLGFGDSGKGRVVDALVRSSDAHCVVRWNGGAQAGHTVVLPDGRHHTFSQFGAGTFVPGVRTLLGSDVCVHPVALEIELARLAGIGVHDALERLVVHRDARVTTPLHQALGRLRELSRGARRDGSCGVGVGEVVRASLAGVTLRASALVDATSVREALRALRDYAKAEFVHVDGRGARPSPGTPEAESWADESWVLHSDAWEEAYVERVVTFARRVRTWDGDDVRRYFATAPELVFEGAQGVLLDELFGFHPHTTWSRCTFDGAIAMLDGHGYPGAAQKIGVLRTYSTRHGPGPFPTEDANLDSVLPEPHNEHGPWQGAVRRGHPDRLLARYAIRACGGVDALALTHLDALGRGAVLRECTRYRTLGSPLVAGEDGHGFVHDGAGHVTALTPRRHASLEAAAERTRRLDAMRADLEDLPPSLLEVDAHVEHVEAALGVRVALGTRGPTHADAWARNRDFVR